MRINEIIDIRSAKSVKAMIKKIDQQLLIIQTFENFNQPPAQSVVNDINILIQHVEKFLIFKLVSDPTALQLLRVKLEELISKIQR